MITKLFINHLNNVLLFGREQCICLRDIESLCTKGLFTEREPGNEPKKYFVFLNRFFREANVVNARIVRKVCQNWGNGHQFLTFLQMCIDNSG